MLTPGHLVPGPKAKGDKLLRMTQQDYSSDSGPLTRASFSPALLACLFGPRSVILPSPLPRLALRTKRCRRAPAGPASQVKEGKEDDRERKDADREGAQGRCAQLAGLLVTAPSARASCKMHRTTVAKTQREKRIRRRKSPEKGSAEKLVFFFSSSLLAGLLVWLASLSQVRASATTQQVHRPLYL